MDQMGVSCDMQIGTREPLSRSDHVTVAVEGPWIHSCKKKRTEKNKMSIAHMEPCKFRVAMARLPVLIRRTQYAHNDRPVIPRRGDDAFARRYSQEEGFGLGHIDAAEECFVWGTVAIFGTDDSLKEVGGVDQASFHHACLVAALLYIVVASPDDISR